MVFKIITEILALLFILEGTMILFNPKWTKTITKSFMKNEGLLKKVAIIELIIGIALLSSQLHINSRKNLKHINLRYYTQK